jgi:hypothetical protein
MDFGYFYVAIGNKIIKLTHIQDPTLTWGLYPNQISTTNTHYLTNSTCELKLRQKNENVLKFRIRAKNNGVRHMNNI